MIDMMGLAFDALTQGLPGVHVSPDYDTTITAPAVKFLATSEGQQANGPGLWVVDMDVSCVAAVEDIWSLVSSVYTVMHATQGQTFPQAHVNEVRDVSIPEFAGETPFQDVSLTQYSGTFQLLCRTV